MSIIEKRQFDRLTQWLRRLTTHDLTAIPLDGVTSVDSWIERLDEHGMIMLHSTGTTGKLSFLPRSRSEWSGWTESFFDALRAATGVDRRKEALPSFYPGYRTGNTTGTKMQRIFGELSAEGEEGRHCLYEHAISSDLLSLAARMRTAEERGELDQLDLDPQLLEERKKLIEAGRRRDADLEAWFNRLAEEFNGQRVRVMGVTGDLVRLALKGQAQRRQVRLRPRLDPVHERRPQGAAGRPRGLGAAAPRLLRHRPHLQLLRHDRVHGLCPALHRRLLPLLPIHAPDAARPGRQRAAARGRPDGPMRLRRPARRELLGRLHQRRPDHRQLGRRLRLRLDGSTARAHDRPLLRARGGRRQDLLRRAPRRRTANSWTTSRTSERWLSRPKWSTSRC